MDLALLKCELCADPLKSYDEYFVCAGCYIVICINCQYGVCHICKQKHLLIPRQGNINCRYCEHFFLWFCEYTIEHYGTGPPRELMEQVRDDYLKYSQQFPRREKDTQKKKKKKKGRSRNQSRRRTLSQSDYTDTDTRKYLQIDDG